MGISTTALVQHYRSIYRERMQGLPIVNDCLAVEAQGFRSFGEHAIGVLITPWFMNLVLLPGTDQWDGEQQGAVAELPLPAQRLDFTVSHDEHLGVYLTAVLFRTVAGFQDQHTAREIALEIMRQLFEAPASEEPARSPEADSEHAVSRRELFTRLSG